MKGTARRPPTRIYAHVVIAECLREEGMVQNRLNVGNILVSWRGIVKGSILEESHSRNMFDKIHITQIVAFSW